MARIFCSTRRLVEDFVLDVQQKFSTRRLVAEKQPPSRRLLERVNIYQTSRSRKIALLDVQQNFYQIPSRTFTRRLVDQMIWANVSLQQEPIGHLLVMVKTQTQTQIQIFIFSKKYSYLMITLRYDQGTHKIRYISNNKAEFLCLGC